MQVRSSRKSASTLAPVLGRESRHEFLYQSFPSEGSCLLPLPDLEQAAAVATQALVPLGRVGTVISAAPLSSDTRDKRRKSILCADQVNCFSLAGKEQPYLENTRKRVFSWSMCVCGQLLASETAS